MENTKQRVGSEIIGTPELGNDNPEFTLNPEKKGVSAIKEAERRMRLDEEIEKNLSAGLDNNKTFVKKYKVIGNKRILVIELIKDKIKDTIENSPEPFVFDEVAMKAMKELEEELTDPFAKNIYNKLSENNKKVLLDHLVDNPVSPEKSEIIKVTNSDDVINILSEATNNTASYSDNGYLVQLSNKRDLKLGTKINDAACLYSLVSPDGKILAQKIDYASVMMLLEEQAENYQQKLKEQFSLEEKPAIIEAEPEPESEAEKEPVKVIAEVAQSEDKQENIFIAPLNEKVSKYAESIGIKPEELATNHEFLNLSPEQQQFALETLHRTSLSKAKVEAHQTFTEEKAGKKWWQVGFAMNQNFHKERHKIEAIKNIESRGLSGYGATELAWLTEVIKNGPEVKVNNVGEVIVDCLSDSGFSDEQKELIAKYNEEARNYIEDSKKENEGLRDIKRELLNNCTDEERERLFYSLNESEKNIQLLKFLSANKETEEMIQKMAGRSLTGFDKAKAMAGAQKDKAGYSALGFVLRTGSKFALANSAYVASALTYSTAPVVAAMVGGLRGYNQGKKSLIENEELAQLGVTDKSATAKALNLAIGENSLKDKLDNLVGKLERLRNENASEEEIKKVKESLQARIYYTQGQMNNESVSYGSTEERGANYLELTNSLVRANSIFWKNTDLLINSEDYYYTGKKTKELTRQTNLYKGIDVFNRTPDVSDPKYREWAQDKERFEELQKVSVEDRLASFLNYKEEAQSRKELKFLLKKTATGAVMGASFAAVGSFMAEHLGLSHWLNGKLNSGKNVAGASATAKVLTPNSSKTNVEVSVNKVEVANTSVVTTPKADHVTSVTNHEEVTSRIEQSPMEEIKRPISEIKVDAPTSKMPTLNTETVSTQAPLTPEAAHSTSVTESVSQEVIDGKKTVNISDSTIETPTQNPIPNNVEVANTTTPINQTINVSEVTSDAPVSDVHAVKNLTSIDNTVSMSTEKLGVIENSHIADTISIAKELHIKPESLNQVGNDLIYNGEGKSNVVFDLKLGGIKEAVDNSGKKIPNEFVRDLVGGAKIEKFTRSGGLEKIFISWNKLGSNDKLFYESLNWFNKGTMSSEDLLNQIKNIYHIKVENVYTDAVNKKFIYSNGRSFDMTLKGVKKLIAFLPRN